MPRAVLVADPAVGPDQLEAERARAGRRSRRWGASCRPPPCGSRARRAARTAPRRACAPAPPRCRPRSTYTLTSHAQRYASRSLYGRRRRSRRRARRPRGRATHGARPRSRCAVPSRRGPAARPRTRSRCRRRTGRRSPRTPRRRRRWRDGRRIAPIVTKIDYYRRVPDELTAALAATVQTARHARGLSTEALARALRRVAGDDRQDRARPGAGDRGAARPPLRRAGDDALRARRRRRARRPPPAPRRRPADVDRPGQRLRPPRAVSPGRPSARAGRGDAARPAPRSPIRPTRTRSSTSRSGCSRAACGSARATPSTTSHPGDCLQLGPPAPCAFVNPGSEPCRYLVALTRRFG